MSEKRSTTPHDNEGEGKKDETRRNKSNAVSKEKEGRGSESPSQSSSPSKRKNERNASKKKSEKTTSRKEGDEDRDDKDKGKDSKTTAKKDADKEKDKKKKKDMEQTDFQGLSNAYPSFELLWFDIQTKVRHLMQEMIEPIVDRQVTTTDTINVMKTEANSHDKRISELKSVVFNTGEKLSIFEEIYERINQVDADRIDLMEKSNYENKLLQERILKIEESNEIINRTTNNLQQHTQQVQDEVIALKETYRVTSENIISEVEKLQQQMINDFATHQTNLTSLNELTESHSNRLTMHDNDLMLLKGRQEAVEQLVNKLKDITANLEVVKADKSTFNKAKKRLNIKGLEHDVKIFKQQNHCSSLDNYLEKYLPIHIQSQIHETLMSILGGRERRRLELYDQNKNSIMYQNLLVDDGSGNIQEKMRALHEKASDELQKQEKALKKKIAIDEATKGKTADADNSVEATALDINKHNSVGGTVEGVGSAQGSPNAGAAQGNNLTGTDESVSVKVGDLKIGPHANLVVNTNNNQVLPSAVTSTEMYRLIDLVASDFKMPETDKDFQLSHEQLVKCVKIILYKMNLSFKKNQYEREELANLINDKVHQIQLMTKQNLQEVNSFLHTVHSDFEHFVSRNKKELSEVHMKMLKQQEDLSSLVNSQTSYKNTVDQHTTVLTCLVEFANMEQALAMQDEDDRHQMKLLGKSERPSYVEGSQSQMGTTVQSNPVSGVFNTVNYNDTKDLKPLERLEHVQNVEGSTRNLAPVKGLKLNGSLRSATHDKKMSKTHQKKKFTERSSILNPNMTDMEDINVDPLGDVLDSKHQTVKAGPLSLNGGPAHTVQMFKMACLSYNPSKVNYRQNILERPSLIAMRRTIIEKCEQLLKANKSNSSAPKPERVFRDLLEYHSMHKPSLSPKNTYHQQSAFDMESSKKNPASFMPAISQRTLPGQMASNSDFKTRNKMHIRSTNVNNLVFSPQTQFNETPQPMMGGIAGVVNSSTKINIDPKNKAKRDASGSQMQPGMTANNTQSQLRFSAENQGDQSRDNSPGMLPAI